MPIREHRKQLLHLRRLFLFSTKTERRGASAFPKKHYTNLNNFMDSLRTQFDFGKIRKSANAAYRSLSQIYKKAGQGFLDDMAKGFGKLIGAIHRKTVEKGVIAPILEQYGVKEKDLDEDFDISDITALRNSWISSWRTRLL